MKRNGAAMLNVEREELAALAVRVDRLVPDRRDPERFHEEKSELAAALRRLAHAAERSTAR